MARPKTEINKKQFEDLCAVQSPETEIAAWFNCSVSTVHRWCKAEYGQSFDKVFEEKRKRGLAALRSRQYEIAMKGNVTMLIFLGKQYLGQKESPELNNGEPIKIEIIR